MIFPAYFLWVGSALPEISRISILSAAAAGFETILFTDRSQEISHPRLSIVSWQEIDMPWKPENVRLRGKNQPYFAGFANLFRYRLLSMHDGWWFDCDTFILKSADDFGMLLEEKRVVFGYEDQNVVNNAIIGSRNAETMDEIYQAALRYYPVFESWGITGPRLVTKLSQAGLLNAELKPPFYFYPVHHNEIVRIYLPDQREVLLSEEKNWYCLSLWNEVLSRLGLKYLNPPSGSYLAELLKRRPELGTITGDQAAIADYLAENQRRLNDLNSGSVAMQTLFRKTIQRFRFGGGRL